MRFVGAGAPVFQGLKAFWGLSKTSSFAADTSSKMRAISNRARVKTAPEMVP